MKIFMRTALLCLLLPAVAWATATPSNETAVAKVDVYVSGQDGYHTYRIPAILAAPNGDLLAFAEGRKTGGGDAGDIDLLLKRSSDGGQTWTPQQVLWDDADNTCGNPCPVVDRDTGVIWLLATHNPGKASEKEIRTGATPGGRTVWVLHSRDHGATWSAPVEITATTKDPSWGWYATGPGIGIQIEHGPHAGRLVIPCDHSYIADASGKPEHGSHAIYSDDHGKSWQLGGTIRPGMNECQVAELFDDRGTLLMDMRSYRGLSMRAQSLSRDGGTTWTPPRDAPQLVEPVCQASLLRWETSSAGAGEGGVLLFSNPAAPKKRIRLTVRASFDNAETWPRSLLLHEGPAAYSCLVALNDQEAGCLYENGEKRPYERITFARFRLNELVPSTP